jgi:phosphotriesterase-related protein
MSDRIRTVLGDVQSSLITGALLHEHMLLAEKAAEHRQARTAVERRLTADFRALIARGCNCFVDASMDSAQPELAASLSARTGMHVVCTTGFYVEATLPAWVRKAPVSRIAAHMHRELTEGAKGTPHRAGMIKVSSNAYGVEPGERKVFLAAAAAHRATGAPITVHAPKGALPQLELLVKAGVKPERVSLAHIEVGPWEDTLKLAKMGAIFVFTNWGGGRWVPEGTIVAQILDLVRRGHVGQITISVDMYLSWVRRRLRQRWAGGYVQIFDRVVPKLLAGGLKDSHIERIVTLNPRRHLAFD